MPIIPFTVLCPGGKPRELGDRLVAMPPGLVLGTGQSASGKLTILIALADNIAGERGSVVLLTDRADAFAPFAPRPPGWSEVVVDGSAAGWERALAGAPSPRNSVVVVSMLSRENARAVIAAGAQRWVLAALDTPLIGLDVGYALREMRVGPEELSASLRCIWSQVLVGALCERCAIDVPITDADRESHDFGDATPGVPKTEAGCADCDGSGISGRVAVSDVTLVTDDLRPRVAAALARGVPAAIDPGLHADGREQALGLLRDGAIGLRTYRDLQRHNPLLRAQAALALARTQSRKLTEMLDAFGSAQWLDVEIFRAIADRTTAGLVAVDPDGRVRFATTAARAMLRDAPLSIAEEFVRAATPRLARALEVALAKAVAPAPAATRLALGAGPRDHAVFVTPLSTARGLAPGARPLALLVLAPQGRGAALPSARALRECFDLTASQCRIALSLCAGRVPKQIAQDLGVSVATVRTQLRALLAKTGTSRQAQLVALLSSFPCTSLEERDTGASPATRVG
ncbi:MAG: helix-turn-helix transcriptional regulator [Burkholderiales bacterium]